MRIDVLSETSSIGSPYTEGVLEMPTLKFAGRKPVLNVDATGEDKVFPKSAELYAFQFRD